MPSSGNNLFITWSGDRSKAVAKAMYEWIRLVAPALHPWMSTYDISAGKDWWTEIKGALSSVSAAIVVLTPENRDNPWVLFESGALFRTSRAEEQGSKGRLVATVLWGLDPPLPAPLGMLQYTSWDKEQLLKLLQDIDKHVSESPDDQLDERFEMAWGKLEKQADEIKTKFSKLPVHVKPNPELVTEEVLNLLRRIDRRLDVVQPLPPSKAPLSIAMSLEPQWTQWSGGGQIVFGRFSKPAFRKLLDLAALYPDEVSRAYQGLLSLQGGRAEYDEFDDKHLRVGAIDFRMDVPCAPEDVPDIQAEPIIAMKARPGHIITDVIRTPPSPKMFNSYAAGGIEAAPLKQHAPSRPSP